jgi:hypothetical protein
MDKKEVPNISDIDLSKLSNLDAVNKVEPSFEEEVDKTERKVKDIRAKKFHFTESELVSLPSKGRFYKDNTNDEDIFSGKIRMMSMTAKEEEILSTPRFIRSGAVIRMILDRCIESDIEAKDILLFDSNYLMFYLRSLSYGDEYTFDIKCSNIMCGRKFKHSINITELEFEELPDDVEEPIVISLPKSKYTIKTILPRLYHSEEINAKNSNRKKKVDDENKRVVDNLLVTTLEILDTNGEKLSKKDWEAFYEALPSYDLAELREKTTFDTGVDSLENIMCPYCEEDYSGKIPIGTNFFRI